MRSNAVDIYINKSRDFAKPILSYIRETVHKGYPEVEEAIRWSFPAFLISGKILCYMAGFKGHCAFGFRLADQMSDPEKLFIKKNKGGGMGNFGKIVSLSDLPAQKILIRYLKEAVKIHESVGKEPRVKVLPNRVTIPDDMLRQLKVEPIALKNFKAFTVSKQREYVEWITEAKSQNTRQKRLSMAVEWIKDGKTRNWKYQKTRKP